MSKLPRYLDRGSSELVATSAPFQDEAIQSFWGWAKNISSPAQGFWFFQPLFYPKVFPSYLPHLTSFCAHSIVRAWESLKHEDRRRSQKQEGRSGSQDKAFEMVEQELEGKFPPFYIYFYYFLLCSRRRKQRHNDNVSLFSSLVLLQRRKWW